MLIENSNWKPSPKDLSSADKIYIRVNLPDGAFHTTMVENNVKVSKVLKNICAKRQLTPSNYILQVASYPDEIISTGTRVLDLKDTTLNLVEKSSSHSNDIMYIEGSESGHSQKKKKSQVQK